MMDHKNQLISKIFQPDYALLLICDD